MTTPLRVGELRPNQLLHTYGVGAVADLPNLSVMLLGLDHWEVDKATPLAEERLLAAIRRKLGPQVETLRTPPYTPETRDPFDDWAHVGVPVAVFPKWLRCVDTRCNQLAPASSGLFELLPSPYAPQKIRYVHNCRGSGPRRPPAVPARFLLACAEGHLDDFPWLYFAHRGAEPSPGSGDHTLKLVERGTTGEAANLFVTCSCAATPRPMSDAIGPRGEQNLPGCRGNHPHLGTISGCALPTRTMVLGATNSWFAMRLRVFSLPTSAGELDRLVADHWPQLSLLALLEEPMAKAVMTTQSCWPDLESFGATRVWQAIRRHADTAKDDEANPDPLDLARPEWEAFIQDADVTQPEFTSRRSAPPETTGNWLERVVLVPRLREVSALYGFTRIDAPEWEVAQTDDRRRVRLTQDAPTWVPCAETRGEGIFLRFDEARVAEWEQREEVRARERVLRAGHDRWRAARGLEPGSWPGIRYLMLHTFAHVLIREFALECGYSAAGIAERIYARGGARPMAGILLYTAAADSEGTLGGLVSLGTPERLGTLLDQALSAARLCGSDPLCAEHDPWVHGHLYGAACHACLFAAETSCERGNHYLDRALVVQMVTDGASGFFE